MKISNQVVLTAVGLVVVSAGVLYPMRGTIKELEDSVQVLESSAAPAMDFTGVIADLDKKLADLRAEMDGRAIALCPDNLEARSQVESAVFEELDKAGLRRIARDRNPGRAVAGVPSFLIELVVEGNAYQLHNFLKGIESLQWATRVLDLEIMSGDDLRRVTMKIAVLLESDS